LWLQRLRKLTLIVHVTGWILLLTLAGRMWCHWTLTFDSWTTSLREHFNSFQKRFSEKETCSLLMGIQMRHITFFWSMLVAPKKAVLVQSIHDAALFLFARSFSTEPDESALPLLVTSFSLSSWPSTSTPSSHTSDKHRLCKTYHIYKSFTYLLTTDYSYHGLFVPCVDRSYNRITDHP